MAGTPKGPGRGEGRRSTAVGHAYGAMTLIMLLTLSILALSASQEPPPTVAEFAPQAQQEIEDPPPEQSSSVGDDGGECIEGIDCEPGPPAASPSSPPDEPSEEPSAEPSPTPTWTEVPRVRQCVGDPPRQIEDPQSPPCVPYWEGDNGGATWEGVTANEIRIAVTEPDGLELWETLFAFFNKRFEFYGRKLVLVHVPYASPDPEVQREGAREAKRQQVFAAFGRSGAASRQFHHEAAALGLLSASHRSTFRAAELQQSHPYLWMYPRHHDGALSDLGGWACMRLAGGNAVHGGVGVQGTSRKVGIIAAEEGGGTQVEILAAELEQCGLDPEPTVVTNSVEFSNQATTVISQMNSAGVTTIFCVCHLFALRDATNAAANQLYEPEWVVAGDPNAMSSGHVAQFVTDTQQRSHMFGVMPEPREVPFAEEPAAWAMKEINPNYNPGSGPTGAISMRVLNDKYRPLLLLASGIQMAGPELTPETFADALQATTFPNPPHRNQPGRVGFPGGTHSMMLDATEQWWSNSDPNAGGTPGTWCYVDKGRRYTPGGWEQPDRLFEQPCHSGGTR